MTTYEKPALSPLGTLHALTQARNKTGYNADVFTAETDVVGSFSAPGPHRP